MLAVFLSPTVFPFSYFILWVGIVGLRSSDGKGVNRSLPAFHCQHFLIIIIIAVALVLLQCVMFSVLHWATRVFRELHWAVTHVLWELNWAAIYTFVAGVALSSHACVAGDEVNSYIYAFTAIYTHLLQELHWAVMCCPSKSTLAKDSSSDVVSWDRFLPCRSRRLIWP